MAGDPRPTDRAVLGLLGVIATILANLLLLMQLFVLKPVYDARLTLIDSRLQRIEAALGVKPAAGRDSVWVQF